MAKNLIFLADGTGNDSDIKSATNVYKLYQRLRCDVPGHARMLPAEIASLCDDVPIEQITQYDAGVGSRPLDLVGKATGRGISKNVKDGYEFFCRFYEPGDRIYLFGFSRGAYTARSLGGLIGLCGIPDRRQGSRHLLHDQEMRLKLVEEAFAIYRTERGKDGEPLREQLAAAFRDTYCAPTDPAIRAPYMIGVWDTVRSLGWASKMGDIELFGQPHLFHDHDLNAYVSYAFHALSIDDERMPFYPTIWNEPTLAQQGNGLGRGQTFSQVWFPGVHSDVGGGYAETALSDITLGWMINRISAAKQAPLFQGIYTSRPHAGLRPDPEADAHDSRDTRWKKLAYPLQARNVARGFQETGKRAINPLESPHQAYVHYCAIKRIQARMERGDYPRIVLTSHTDIQLAQQQLRDKLPPNGPYTYIDDVPV